MAEIRLAVTEPGLEIGNVETVLEELQTNCYFLTSQKETRKLLAWQDIDEEKSDRLNDAQRHQLAQSLKKSERDLREAVWRTYRPRSSFRP